MDTKTNIFGLDNEISKLEQETKRPDLFSFVAGRNDRTDQYFQDQQAQKQAKEEQYKQTLRANGFQEQVQEDRTDKNLRRNYLNSLEYNDQKKFIELYNQNKDLGFGDVIKKLEEESETARGGGLRAQINAQNERSALDYANIVGLATEELDDRVQNNTYTYSNDQRKQDLRNKVANLPLEQQMSYVQKYNNSESLQNLYKNAYEYALHQNSSLLDNMLDTWEEEDVGPNLGVMMANIPSSTLKTFSASVRGITNPYDTLKGLASLIATEEGRQILKERYGGWDAIARTMEEDPVGLASDVMSVTGNVGKAGGLATRGVGMVTKNPITKAIGKGIQKIGNTIDDASDMGIAPKLGETISTGIEQLQKGGIREEGTLGSRLSKNAGKYLGLTQQPLRSIRKTGSKLYNSFGDMKGSDGKTTEGVISRLTNGVTDRLDQFKSGLTKEERMRYQNNPYAQEEWRNTKDMIDNSGMPVDPQRITEEGYQRIGDELKQRIDEYERNLNENGQMYEALKNNPTKYDLSDGINAIKQFFREEGITDVDGQLIFKHGTKEEQSKIQEARNQIKRNGIANTDFSNYHRVRQDLDNIAKYTEGVNTKKYKSVRKMRALIDESAKKKIPGLKKIDDVYAKQIKELEEIKQGLVYKGGDQKGNFRDNFYSIMRTLNKQNRQAMKGRLEEKIFPGIAERVEAVDMASKLAKVYQDSPSLMKVLGKLLGFGGTTGGLITGAVSLIIGAVLDELVMKPRGEKMRKNAIEKIMKEMSPEAKQKLADISSKLQAGVELKETDKMILEEATQEIKEAMDQENKRIEEENKQKEERKKKADEEWKKVEEKQKKEKSEFDDFMQDMNESTKAEDNGIHYERLSDETLNKLRDDESLPQSERDQIEKILRERTNNEITRDAQKGESENQFGVKDEVEFVRRAHQLQNMEKNLGKVGRNTIKDPEVKKRREMEFLKKKEAFIEEIGETYGIDQEEAYNKFLDFENRGINEENYSKRGGTKNANSEESEILATLEEKKKEWNKKPEFMKDRGDQQNEMRDYFHGLLRDGYEVTAKDKGDRISKNGEIVGNIIYNKDGTIKELILKDAYSNDDRRSIESFIPADAIIRDVQDTNGITARDFREMMDIDEPKYQRAYHGGPNSFDRFDLSHTGEGEGNQAHGYGHYVALTPEVARRYAEKGGTGYYKYKGDDLGFDPDDMEMVNGEGKIAYYMVNDLEHGKSFDEAKKENMEWIEREMEDADDEYIYQLEEMKDALENMKESDFSKTNRNFYEIEIPDEVKKNTPTGTNYLDEGVTISAKAGKEIADKLREKGHAEQDDIFGHSEEYLGNILGDIEKGESGKSMYEDIAVYLGGQKQASEFLNDLGYDGIKYDGEKDGPCAVLFTDEAMNIVNHEKYQIADQTKTPEFKKRFEGSKVVDENGNPLVVYHGTNAKFNTFDGIKTEPGYRFTEDFDYAKEHGDNVKSVYLNIKNVADLDTMRELGKEKFGDNVGEKQLLSNEFKDYLIEKGYDGMVWDHDGKNTYIAFNPNQIKSATDNIGTFDPNNPDIRYQNFGVANANDKNISSKEGLQIENFKNGRTVEEIAKNYGIETQLVDKILTPEGQKALGSYGNNIIKLAKSIKESTAPHELLHAVFDMVDQKKKDSILKSIMNGKGLDRINAEERLADRFSEYFRTGKFDTTKAPQGFINRVKEFFTKIKEFINGTWKERKQIQQLFDDIIGEKDFEGKKSTKETYQQAGDIYGDNFKKWFGDWENDPQNASKVVNEDGTPKIMYHGTPNAGFTEFYGGSYFTENKEYADNYQNPNASSISYKKDTNSPGTYAVYLDIKKPFDTRDPKAREIFETEYMGNYGMGTPLSERGLPDRMDGNDLLEFIKEKHPEYDGLILDEGGIGGYGETVTDRGLSYVPFEPNQIKSATDNIGTYDVNNPDIRYEKAGDIYGKNFKNRFGDRENNKDNASKIVNEDGTPMIMYHGTNADFNAFDRDTIKSSNRGEGFYFTSDKNSANQYGKNVKAVYLDVKNPLDLTTSKNDKEYNKRYGKKNSPYDGYIVKIGDETMVIVKDPNQIKSATDNVGTYSKESDDIRYQLDSKKDGSNTKKGYDLNTKNLDSNNRRMKRLDERVSGDDLLNAQDLIEEIQSVGAQVDYNGLVTVYHQTTPENAQKILESGKMMGKEKGIFFSTSNNATQADGRGTVKMTFKIPVEKLELDDLFSDNADLKIISKPYELIDVSEYIVK